MLRLSTDPNDTGENILFIGDIPALMEKTGRTIGAKMMRRWFAQEAFELSVKKKADYSDDDSGATKPELVPNSNVESGIIAMDWALQTTSWLEGVIKNLNYHWFRGTDGWLRYDRLKSHCLIEKLHWQPGMSVRLGNVNNSAHQCDQQSQIAMQAFPRSWNTSDFSMAIGSSTLKMAVVGHTMQEKDRFTDKMRDYFVLEKVGFYLRDTYDFTDDVVQNKADADARKQKHETWYDAVKNMFSHVADSVMAMTTAAQRKRMATIMLLDGEMSEFLGYWSPDGCLGYDESALTRIMAAQHLQTTAAIPGFEKLSQFMPMVAGGGSVPASPIFALWAPSPNAVSTTAKEALSKVNIVPVHNKDFRAYREKTGKGADFVVYSDVLWQEPATVSLHGLKIPLDLTEKDF